MAETSPKSPALYDPIKGTVYGNILDKFDSPMYNLKLYMIPPVANVPQAANTQANQANQGANARVTTAAGGANQSQGGYMNGWYVADPRETIVLAQTGVTGNQIDALQITSAIGPGGSFETSKINFDIIQPGTANFIDQIIAAKAKIGAPVFSQDVPLFLEISFKGYTEDLDDPAGGGEPTTITGPYRYRLIISTVNIEITEKGSVYNFECVAQSGIAYRDQHFRLPATLTSTGKTIEEYVSNLTVHLSDYANEHNTGYAIKDVVEFDLSGLGEFATKQLTSNLDDKAEDINRIMNPELLNKTPDEYKDILAENDKDEGNLEILVADDKITFREGVTIETFFATLLSMNDEFFAGLTRTKDPDDPKKEKELYKKKPFVKWFKINASWKYIDYDNKRNMYAKKIIYKPVIFDRDGSTVQADAKENTVLSKDEVQARLDGMSIFKSYHYTYTGRNDQIINCRINYNAGFTLLTAPAGGATGDFSTTQAGAMSSSAGANDDLTGQDQAQGAKNVSEKEKADQLVNSASDDQIRNYGNLLGFSDAEIKSAQSDKSSQSAQILKAVLADRRVAQAVQDTQAAQNRITQSDNIRNTDGGTYTNKASGYIYSADIIDGVSERMDTALTMESAKQRVTQLRKNAQSPSDQEVGEVTDNLEPGVQQIHVTNPAESATYDGTTKNTIFGYVMQQHNSSDFLVKLNMEIKGDPWYLGPPNTLGYDDPELPSDQDTEETTPDNASFKTTENYVMFEMQTPRLFDFDVDDEDNNTGYWEPAGTSYFMSGIYRMVTVTSSFNDGSFSQEIDLNKLTPLKISMVNKVPPTSQGSN